MWELERGRGRGQWLYVWLYNVLYMYVWIDNGPERVVSVTVLSNTPRVMNHEY